MKNEEVVGKFIIVNDLTFTDFMKDENNDIVTYDTFGKACTICAMYEFENALVLKAVYNYVDEGDSTFDNKLIKKIDELIQECDTQVELFEKNEMLVSSMTSDAMKYAYTNIKNIILNS